MNKTFYTLITGASLGIGRAFAYECARRGMNLFLVALPDENLVATEKELKNKFDVKIQTLGIDLTRDEAAEYIYKYALSHGIDVNILINNAGMGTSGLFEDSNTAFNLKMVKLNIQSTISVTRHFIKQLKENTPSYVLNVSSLEAALPIPYKAVYTGTKNFIYSFSLALKEELRGSGTHVSVLCPGPVLTNKGGLERIKSQGRKAKLMVLMPEKVASMAIRNMLNKKTEIIPGVFPRLLFRISRCIPTPWKMRILERVFRVYRVKKIEPEKSVEEKVTSA